MNDIAFAELDSAAIEAAVIAGYERVAQTTLYAGDPVRLFLESLAYALTIQNHVINQAGAQTLLAHATGGHLEARRKNRAQKIVKKATPRIALCAT